MKCCLFDTSHDDNAVQKSPRRFVKGKLFNHDLKYELFPCPLNTHCASSRVFVLMRSRCCLRWEAFWLFSRVELGL